MIMQKRESVLHDELFDIEYDIIQVLENLINAEWDSSTLQNKIVGLMKQKFVIEKELYVLNGDQH